MYVVERKYGSLYLLKEQTKEILVMYTTFSILCESGDLGWTVLRYGELETIKEYKKKIHAMHETAPDEFGDTKVRLLVDNDKNKPWPVDMINRCMDTTGYVKDLIRYVDAIDVGDR